MIRVFGIDTAGRLGIGTPVCGTEAYDAKARS